MSTDLAAWLLEQIDADTRLVMNASVPGSASVALSGGPAQTYWSKDRALAECDAKRRVINEYLVNDADAMADKDDFATRVARTNAATLYRALQCLALPYADRPGYREEWRP